MVRTHNCGAGLVCKNTDGSFVCGPKQKCLTGFKLDSHGNCIGKGRPRSAQTGHYTIHTRYTHYTHIPHRHTNTNTGVVYEWSK